MKDKILKVLEDYGRALTFEEVDSALNIKTVEETLELKNTLKEMEESGDIYHSNKDKFMLFSNSNLRKGKLRISTKGYGFVEVKGEEDEDIFISRDNLNKALDGDEVVVEITEIKEDKKIEGVYTTNLSYIPKEYQEEKWLHVCDCSEYLANIIYNIHNDISITELLRDRSLPMKLIEEKFS